MENGNGSKGASEDVPCFIDNQAALYDRDRRLFWLRSSGELLGGPEQALANRHLSLDEVAVLVTGKHHQPQSIPYYIDKWSFTRVGAMSDEVSVFDMEEKLAGGAVLTKQRGGDFREAMRQEWTRLWKTGTGEHETVNGRDLEYVYLDNSPCAHDTRNRCFIYLDGEGTVTEKAAREGGMHLSRLRIAVFKDKAYYTADGAVEMRRVGRPSERVTFDAMDMLHAEGWGLSFPGGRFLRAVLEKEKVLDAQLPKIRLNGKEYTSDTRFRECRGVVDREEIIPWDVIEAYPHNFMHSLEGRSRRGNHPVDEPDLDRC